jgi:hypothetical protein
LHEIIVKDPEKKEEILFKKPPNPLLNSNQTTEVNPNFFRRAKLLSISKQTPLNNDVSLIIQKDKQSKDKTKSISLFTSHDSAQNEETFLKNRKFQR